MTEALAFLTAWAAAEVSTGAALALVALSFFTSALTGALGIGGGVAMLAVLASLMPPITALPIHGTVQLGSNLGRAGLLRRHIHRRLWVLFALGSLVGISLGTWVFVALPRAVLELILALFILYSVWAPTLKPADLPPSAFALVGAVATFCTMFTGATGPLVAAFLSPERLQRHGVVATHAACMSLQHGLKVAAFGYLGFNYWPWLALLAAMIAAGFLGTLAGRQLLDQLPERAFAWGFRIVLTLLALRMVWSALG